LTALDQYQTLPEKFEARRRLCQNGWKRRFGRRGPGDGLRSVQSQAIIAEYLSGNSALGQASPALSGQLAYEFQNRSDRCFDNLEAGPTDVVPASRIFGPVWLK